MLPQERDGCGAVLICSTTCLPVEDLNELVMKPETMSALLQGWSAGIRKKRYRSEGGREKKKKRGIKIKQEGKCEDRRVRVQTVKLGCWNVGMLKDAGLHTDDNSRACFRFHASVGCWLLEQGRAKCARKGGAL